MNAVEFSNSAEQRRASLEASRRSGFKSLQMWTHLRVSIYAGSVDSLRAQRKWVILLAAPKSGFSKPGRFPIHREELGTEEFDGLMVWGVFADGSEKQSRQQGGSLKEVHFQQL